LPEFPSDEPLTTKAEIILAGLIGMACLGHADAAPEPETRYLAFQIFTPSVPMRKTLRP
jgi:hypothetical protein